MIVAANHDKSEAGVLQRGDKILKAMQFSNRIFSNARPEEALTIAISSQI